MTYGLLTSVLVGWMVWEFRYSDSVPLEGQALGSEELTVPDYQTKPVLAFLEPDLPHISILREWRRVNQPTDPVA